ncbi:MAG TPA: PadR family transcriptional regulator [Actinomycetota bacterium]|jgi:DNA-binding PadR family transcriptional regulator|nr:PadR family transcriptional regulator [Actinomycetota bacterium]
MHAVKYALLGLLATGRRHGYDLKGAFEDLLGGSWELNIGQVYTTLARLERDGLVRSRIVPQDLVPDRKVYEITPAGRTELKRWLGEPANGPVRLKDELLVKVLVQSVVKDGDAGDLIARQRLQHLQTLSQLSELREDEDLNPATRLIVEGAMLHVEADLEWLDLCEERLTRRGRR